MCSRFREHCPGEASGSQRGRIRAEREARSPYGCNPWSRPILRGVPELGWSFRVIPHRCKGTEYVFASSSLWPLQGKTLLRSWKQCPAWCTALSQQHWCQRPREGGLGPEWSTKLSTWPPFASVRQKYYRHMRGNVVRGLSYGRRIAGKRRMRGQALGRFAIFNSLKNNIEVNTKLLYLIGVPLPMVLPQYFLCAWDVSLLKNRVIVQSDQMAFKKWSNKKKLSKIREKNLYFSLRNQKLGSPSNDCFQVTTEITVGQIT